MYLTTNGNQRSESYRGACLPIMHCTNINQAEISIEIFVT
jgi:hypothetical protein